MLEETNSASNVRLVPAVVQAMKILRTIASAPRGLTVTSTAREAGISQSSCFNILRTLVQERVLNFDSDTKTYTLGLGLVEIASAVQNLTDAEVIRPELSRIANQHNALVTLWKIVDNGRMVLIDRVAAPRAVTIEVRIGQRLPVLSGAVGRCAAAYLGLSKAQLQKKFDALAWEDAPSFNSFFDDVQRAKLDGYALDCGDWLRGINAVGSVVLDPQKRPHMGIGALTLTDQLDEAALRRLGEDLFSIRTLIEKTLFSAGRAI